MGVFIYKTRGTFPNNFIIDAIDLILMAKGSAAEVGYVTDGELLGDICDLGYEECSRGIWHSHHGMSTNWSSTDTEQVKLAASTGPYYVSVVSNNKLEFTAKVAIKSETELKGFSFFKDLKGKRIKSEQKIYKKDTYEIIECEVELEKPQYMLDVDDRIETKLQHYVTTGGAVGKGNEISGKGKTTFIKDNMKAKSAFIQNLHSNNYEDYGEGYDLFNSHGYYNKPQTWEKPVGYNTHKRTPPDDNFIKIALRKYCKPDGQDLSVEQCMINIVDDSEHYGIELPDYIDCFRRLVIFTLDRDNAISKGLNELNSIKVG
jgi:hypothetical protein